MTLKALMAFLYSLCADSLEHLPTDITTNYVGNFQLSSGHKKLYNLSLSFDIKKIKDTKVSKVFTFSPFKNERIYIDK